MSKAGKAHLNDLYKKPLPVHNVVPLPALTQNPISLLYYLYQFFFASIPSAERYRGTLNVETRSVWITDEASASALWYCGFFGKGQYSRSEPSWFVRTQRALGLIGKDERLTSEEVTARRRVARADMKAERARKEKEVLEATLRAEGRLPGPDTTKPVDPTAVTGDAETEDEEEEEVESASVTDPVPDLEHLQLTLYEALFLSDALDALDIYQPESSTPMEKNTLLSCFSRLCSTPSDPDTIMTDCHFLIQYAVYHHYRSLGWTVKPGIKFGVDWLLYKRGPVFSHAEFSIIVMPAARTAEAEVDENEEGRPWWWLHTLSRVNGQVKKTVILTYVQFELGKVNVEQEGLERVMKRYNIREVSLKRWIPSRNRD
ncbi:Probable tRNA-splicing endonuclease subunit sen2 [Taphrina deformans PYCC 5710]|uniref:tRNA-splicing endonuclease subunit Sen2 n=1 Tax=Taphrina deformans (strain PYCC 5710 / ATCC 11124 / CBS 356.35 / IMI 108563 / JCM 9778 / NBRC 8474) TaxID=1097556 RepID=R4XIH3_TAPDE|nr:Probable tRNA-splicing endonuclease subunit sen2 [Taphrina deformans PYCC 5710]|eukprot:CCG83157.1 Probable tRNA-splicing endonuclease subunit sen2 [Taphrina deformans PYCC 5710]